MQINKLLTFTLLALTPILAQAAIYKWVDEHGNVQYSSEKPDNAEAEKIRVNTQPPLDSSANRRTDQEQDQTADKGDKKDAADDKPKTPAEKRAEQSKKAESDKLKQEMCAEARDNLATIENSARVRLEDANGEVRYLSEEEVASRTKSERERVSKYCK